MKKSKLILISYSVLLAITVVTLGIGEKSYGGAGEAMQLKSKTVDLPAYKTIVTEGQRIMIEGSSQERCEINYTAKGEAPKLNYTHAGDTLYISASDAINSVTFFVKDSSVIDLVVKNTDAVINEVNVKKAVLKGTSNATIRSASNSEIDQLFVVLDQSQLYANNSKIQRVSIQASQSEMRMGKDFEEVSGALNNNSKLYLIGDCLKIGLETDKTSRFIKN